MKIKPNYIIIPLITIIVAIIGNYFSSAGMDWYDTAIIKPAITPPKWAFPVAWNTIFLLTTASALIVWNKFKKGERRTTIMYLFAANAVLNVLWSYLFFNQYLILASFIEMIVIEITIISIMVLAWKYSKKVSLLLIPYAAWVVLASELTYLILKLN